MLFTGPLEDRALLEVCSFSTALLIFSLIVWSQLVALWHIATSKHSCMDFMGAFQAYSNLSSGNTLHSKAIALLGIQVRSFPDQTGLVTFCYRHMPDIMISNTYISVKILHLCIYDLVSDIFLVYICLFQM